MTLSWKQALKDYAEINKLPFKIYKKDSIQYNEIKKMQGKGVKGSGNDEIITSGVGVITSDIVKEVIDDLKKEKKQRKKKNIS